jgi:hypothetical protein
MYTNTVTVSDVVITTKDQFEQQVTSGMRTAAQRITVDDFTLPVGANKNITGVVSSELTGQSELVITGRVKAVREDSFKELARYTVYAPEIILEPTVTGRTVALRVLNADDTSHEDIIIDWSDGATDTVPVLNSGADKPLTHTYAAAAPMRVTIKARYQDGSKAVEKAVAASLAVTGTVPAPTSSEPTPAPSLPPPVATVPSVPVVPDQPQPTGTVPTTEPVPIEKAPKDERGVITKILDWLEALFA